MSWRRFAPKQWTSAHFRVCFGKGGLADRKVPFITEHVIMCGEHQFKVDTLVSPNVVVEHLGESHERERRREKDEWRAKILRSYGYKVLEFWDSEVDSDFEGVLTQILQEVG